MIIILFIYFISLEKDCRSFNYVLFKMLSLDVPLCPVARLVREVDHLGAELDHLEGGVLVQGKVHRRRLRLAFRLHQANHDQVNKT
jgi:hypothetical protein